MGAEPFQVRMPRVKCEYRGESRTKMGQKW